VLSTHIPSFFRNRIALASTFGILASWSMLTATPASVAAADSPVPDFSQAVRPFLEKHCLGCHGATKPEAELSLDRFRDATTMIKSRKVWMNVVKLVRAGEMPPSDKPQPTAADVEAFANAVKTIFDHADRTAKPDPGRVTMRRLNRVEYRNTIRDLVGVDFDPTEDFPADDIGHGFDNIGDVLTLSPVLMERYLAAAESVMSRAITPNPPAPPKRHLSSRYTEPASANVPLEGNFRIVRSDGDSPVASGPVHTQYQFDPEGDYIFRSRVYAKKQGDQPVRAAVLVIGKEIPNPSSDDEAAQLAGQAAMGLRPFRIVETLEITADDPKKPQLVEVKIPASVGRQRTAIALLKPAEGQPAATLYVEHLALEGPLDTRPSSHRRLLAVDPAKPAPEQTRPLLEKFASRAYRRPATNDEVDRLAKLVEQSMSAGESWESSMQMGFQAVLCSPKFLFRVELDDRPEAPESRPLDPFQLASRLSYFLWSSMPDDELFAEARAGTLLQNIEPQVRRMLQDPRSDSLVRNFALQWLQVKRLETFAPDARMFPQFNDRLRAAMFKETELFISSVIREDRSILELLDADYTFLNEPLARLYGIADTHGNLVGKKPENPGGQPIRGEQFQRVALQSRARGGLVTQASVLAVNSNPTRTSPVKRGRWILEQLLGEPPPVPPPNVPELPNDEKAVAGASLRERLEIHRRNPTCANCHEKMDPLGFALENYDAIGAFRTKDGTFDVDPAGRLPDGTTFQGPEDLKSILKERRGLFSRCLAEKMLTYALGRGVEYYDRPTIENIATDLEANEFKFSRLVLGIVTSEPFRLRRGSNEQ
jgi:mono/diheme cytochrome c family protein